MKKTVERSNHEHGTLVMHQKKPMCNAKVDFVFFLHTLSMVENELVDEAEAAGPRTAATVRP